MTALSYIFIVLFFPLIDNYIACPLRSFDRKEKRLRFCIANAYC